MANFGNERVLLVGDGQRQVHAALIAAFPGAQVKSVGNYFDAIAELAGGDYTAVLASAEPIDRRPEAAVRTLREMAGNARLILFGAPACEPLSRRMLDFGCDDYLVSPATAAELQQAMGSAAAPRTPPAAPEHEGQGVIEPSAALGLLHGIELTDLFLDALLHRPADAAAAVIAKLNEMLGPGMRLELLPAGQAAEEKEERGGVTHPVRDGAADHGRLHLAMGQEEDSSAARHFLARLASLVAKSASLQERHNSLQKLAITDELTGLYNGRYFRHFLGKILEKARGLRFQVTLLLFDIDNFKQYNDRYGHAVGDEILKETAALMRRCCREHDLVARVGGDEFAVVFWEKEGPRQPKGDAPDGAAAARAAAPSRPPQTPVQIFERFKRLLATQDFRGLGAGGKGTLSASGGLANFPYDGRDVDELVRAADHDLMFRAKQGRNSIYLVGGVETQGPQD